MSKNKLEPSLEELEKREAEQRFKETPCRRCGFPRNSHIELKESTYYNGDGTDPLLCPTALFEE